MAGVLSSEHLGSLAVITIIACALAQEPLIGTIEMLIYQVGSQTFHLGPQVVKLVTLGVGP